MALFLQTTNALTAAHGHSPLRPRTPANFERGWVIYLEITANAFLRARQFYQDFTGPVSSVEQQRQFEQNVVANSRLPENDPMSGPPPAKFGFDLTLVDEANGRTKQPFPYAFYATLDRVDFGWKPCHVTYILANSYYNFLEPSATTPETSLSQPVVFRSSKVVEENQRGIVEGEYSPNYTYYNLTVDNTSEQNYSFLRFDNFMLDENGSPISRGAGGEIQRVWKYCMDMNVRVPSRKLNSLHRALAAKSANNPIPRSSLIVVFDPPNTNGGGMGAEP
jgi:hypothetical protein